MERNKVILKHASFILLSVIGHFKILVLKLSLFFSIQQPPVLCNLQFQPHLDVQQKSVLSLLLLDGKFQLLHFHFQRGDG